MAYNPYTTVGVRPTFAAPVRGGSPSEYAQYKVKKEHYDRYQSPEAVKRQASQLLSIYGSQKDTTGYLNALKTASRTGQFTQIDAARLQGRREGQLAGAQAETYKQGFEAMSPQLTAQRNMQQASANANSKPSYAAGGTTGEGTFGSPLADLAAGTANAGQATSGTSKPALSDRLNAVNSASSASRFGRGRGRGSFNRITGTGAARTFGRGDQTASANSGYDGNLSQTGAGNALALRQATGLGTTGLGTGGLLRSGSNIAELSATGLGTGSVIRPGSNIVQLSTPFAGGPTFATQARNVQRFATNSGPMTASRASAAADMAGSLVDRINSQGNQNYSRPQNKLIR